MLSAGSALSLLNHVLDTLLTTQECVSSHFHETRPAQKDRGGAARAHLVSLAYLYAPFFIRVHGGAGSRENGIKCICKQAVSLSEYHFN
jgi:hypothetical protein